MEQRFFSVTGLAFANIWLALSASGLALAAFVACDVALDVVALLLPALTTYVVYTFDKVVKLDPVADVVNDPERTRFLVRHRRLLLTLAGLALVGGGVLAATRGPLAFVLFMVPFPIGFAYSTPVLPRRFRYRRIKDLTGGKSLVVALTWSIMAVSLPLAATGAALDTGLHALAFLWIAARFFVNTVLFDIDDVPGDRAAGIRTLPVWLGVPRTFTLLRVTLVVALGIGLGMAWLGTPVTLAIVLLSAAFDVVYLEAARRRRGPLGFLGDVVADGLGVWSGVVTLALVALG